MRNILIADAAHPLALERIGEGLSMPGKQSDKVAGAYDQGASTYVENWSGVHPWMSDARNEFERRISAGMTLLDIGCGPGHDSWYWSEKGMKTLGIDISSRTIAVAQRLYPKLAFRIFDVLELEKIGAKFDAIWMAYSLLHIAKADAPSTVQAVRYCLKPNGLFFVETSISESTSESIRPIAGLKDGNGQEIEVPYTAWSEKDLGAMLDPDFKLEWSKVYSVLPGRPKVWSGIMRRL